MSYPNRSPSIPRGNNGSWFHLSVDGSTLLKIPPVNQTVLVITNGFFQNVVLLVLFINTIVTHLIGIPAGIIPLFC